MAPCENERIAISARYLVFSRELELTLDDGSRHQISVDRLEMLESTPDALVPIDRPTDEQLSDVRVWGGGTAVYWKSIKQVFQVEELILGIYGRPAWMESLSRCHRQPHT